MDDASRPDPDLDALLSRFRESGDPRALAALFDAAAPGLFRTALHLAPDAASAEDALQEAFLALIEATRRGDRIDSVGGWLAGTLRNKVLRGRRREARAPDPLRLEPRILERDPPSEAARAEEIARVRAALEDLPEPYREVAILRWRYGVEPAAIAHARGVPPGTVRSLLSRAADRLRASLGALAAVAFDVRPPRGLDAVRADLLRAAASAVPASAAAGAAAAVLGGAILAKKTMAGVSVAVIGLCLLLLGWWWTAKDGKADSRGSRTESAVAARAPVPSPTPPDVASASSPDTPSGSASASGTRVLVRDALTGVPIAGAAVAVAGGKEKEPLRTAADGTAGLPAAAVPGSKLEATAEGYGPGSIDLPGEAIPEVVELQLVPGLERAKAAFIAAAKRREALLSSCRIRSWRLSWRGTDGHLFMAEELVTDLDGPRERWVRRGIGLDGKPPSVDLVPESEVISSEIEDAVRWSPEREIVVLDGKRQLVLYPTNGHREVRQEIDTFFRRGAIVWSALRLESAWLSELTEKNTLRLARASGADEWQWLFVTQSYRGQVWLYRVVTTGGDQLLPIRETVSRVEEGDLEMAVRRCESAFDQFEPRETVQSTKTVNSTVSVRGLLLPERAGGDALFVKETPRAFSRYWLQYEPRDPGSWPDGYFDTSQTTEQILESLAANR